MYICMNAYTIQGTGLFVRTYNFIIIISFDAVDYLAVGGLTEWAAGGDLRPLKDAGKTIGICQCLSRVTSQAHMLLLTFG